MSGSLQRATLIAFMLGGSGCDSPNTSAAAHRSSAAATPSIASAKPRKSKLVGFSAKLGDTELVLDSALAFSRGGAALHVTLSTHPLECEKITGAGFRLEPAEFLVDFTVAPVTVPGKGEQWMVTGSRLGDVSRQGALGHVETTATDPRNTVKMSMQKVALAFPPTMLVLDGKLTAMGCGVVPLTERAKVRPQKELKVLLDDKPLTMNGASIVNDARGRTLRITSEPHACDKGVLGSDVGIEVTLARDDSTMTRLRVSGFSVARPLSTEKSQGGLSIRFDGADAGAEQSVAVTGEVGMGGHTLLIDGIAHVEICP